MTKRIQSMSLLVAAGALLAVPAIGEAHHKPGHTKGGGQGRSCTHKPTVNKAFVVKGTLVSYTADDPATTDVNEANVEITVTRANRHARVSGELQDTNATKPGVQVAGGPYTADGTPTPTTSDPFKVKLSQYEPGETPGAGDRVHITGKIAVTRKRCAPAGESVADRYGSVNVRRVKIRDAD